MRPTEIDPGEFRPASQIKTVRNLLPYLWPAARSDLRVRVFFAVVLMVSAKFANVYVPILLSQAVDSLSAADAETLVIVPLGLLLAYGLARILARGFDEARNAVFSAVAQNAIRQVALQTFRRLHALSLRFHLERRTGGLGRAIDRGVKSIEFLLFFFLFNVVPTIFELLLVCGILWALFDWRFAAVTFCTIGAYVAVTFMITEWRIRLRRQMNLADNDANTKVVDSLLNYETVKYFNNEDHEARRFDSALQIYESAANKSRTSLSLLNATQATAIAIGITLNMILAAQGVAAGTMTVGAFVMVNAYLLQIAIPLNLLGTVYREIKQSLIDIDNMFELIHTKAEVEDSPHATDYRYDGGTIAFRNVSFAYDPRKPVLSDVDFLVPPGKTLAIVGSSGAGKSTISRLLFRFYDVTEGAIEIDGQDLRTLTQDSLRRALGIVPQDTVLFNDSIYYNIAYGRPEAQQAEVYEAARLARIHDFVMGLPDGYDTRVGERGLKLSGGEKQRVAIARTILKEPKILVFDEATSALDTKTEQDIQKSLTEVSKERTTLIIAHRLSTVVAADEILVLDKGQITERGTHPALLAMGGLYAEMWARQQRAPHRTAGE